jgi:hypothetical protein
MNLAKILGGVFLGGFGVALGIVVAQRLSIEAIAVMIGVIAGVAASVPTSVVVAWMASRMAQRSANATYMPPAEPRIIVVPPGAPLPVNEARSIMPDPMMPESDRDFRVIGGADVVLQSRASTSDASSQGDLQLWQR